MNSYLGSAGLTICYFCLFYLFGRVSVTILKRRQESFAFTISIGIFTYYILFSMIGIPFKILLRPLSELTVTWVGVCVCVVILNVVMQRKHFMENIRNAVEHSKKEWYLIILMLFVVLGQVFLMNFNAGTGALWDQAYYIGDVSSSVYTNTISQYDPNTGMKLTTLHTEYLLETYQNHSAVVCQLLGMAPLIEMRTVMGSVVVILHNLILYQIGMFLFKKNRRNTLIFLFFIALLEVYSFNLFTRSEFMYFRAYEGKTILAVIIIPILFLQFLRLTRAPKAGYVWWETLLIICGSFGMNMSSIYMIPFTMGTLLVPLAVHERSMKMFLRFIGLMIPCVVMIAAYILTRHFLHIYT